MDRYSVYVLDKAYRGHVESRIDFICKATYLGVFTGDEVDKLCSIYHLTSFNFILVEQLTVSDINKVSETLENVDVTESFLSHCSDSIYTYSFDPVEEFL